MTKRAASRARSRIEALRHVKVTPKVHDSPDIFGRRKRRRSFQLLGELTENLHCGRLMSHNRASRAHGAAPVVCSLITTKRASCKWRNATVRNSPQWQGPATFGG